MKHAPSDCFSSLKTLLNQIAVTDREGNVLSANDGLAVAVEEISAVQNGKVMFVGNGASASIASHMATDFWKNAGVPAFAFNDGALLTCISNDFGYKHVFEKPILFFGGDRDVLIAISSSGQSENILRAASAAREVGARVFTLSGFKNDNPLRAMGHLNFYSPSDSYGLVEVSHHAICHYIVDQLCLRKPSGGKMGVPKDRVSQDRIREIRTPDPHHAVGQVKDHSV